MNDIDRIKLELDKIQEAINDIKKFKFRVIFFLTVDRSREILIQEKMRDIARRLNVVLNNDNNVAIFCFRHPLAKFEKNLKLLRDKVASLEN